MYALRRYLARSDSASARWARDLIRWLRCASLPAPRLIFVPVLWLVLAVRSVYHVIAQKLVCEPLFKAYCTSYGRNLRTGVVSTWSTR